MKALVRRALRLWLTLPFERKIAGAMTGCLCLAILSLSAVSLRQQRKMLHEDMWRRADGVLQQLALAGGGALSGRDPQALAASLERLRRRADVLSVAVYDKTGMPVTEYRRDSSAPSAVEASGKWKGDVSTRHSKVGGEPALEASVAIVDREMGGLPIGTARVAMSEARIEKALWRQTKVFAGLATAFIGGALLLSFLLGKLLARDVQALSQAMEAVAEGRFNRLVRVRSRDQVGRLASSFNAMTIKLREKMLMERYLSQSTIQVVKRMRATERLRLGGERRRVAVLFSDVRGFTEMTETLPAEEVVETLNLYLNTQAEVIYKRGGVVDKFIGDSVMAIFTEKDAEFRAALAAQEIKNFVASLNETRASRGQRVIQVGLGLNVGEVVMGNMGSERQMDYTVVGDPINIAARLCQSAQAGQAVMSWPMLSAIAGRCRWGMLPNLQVKGKALPLEAYELRDVPGAARRHMRRHLDHRAFVVLQTDERHEVKVHEISQDGCSIEIPVPLESGALIDLDLAVEFLPAQRVRAVVQNLKKREGWYRAGLRFSDLGEAARRSITEWVHHIEVETAAA